MKQKSMSPQEAEALRESLKFEGRDVELTHILLQALVTDTIRSVAFVPALWEEGEYRTLFASKETPTKLNTTPIYHEDGVPSETLRVEREPDHTQLRGLGDLKTREVLWSMLHSFSQERRLSQMAVTFRHEGRFVTRHWIKI